MITSLGEEGAGLCASRAFVCLFCACWCLSFSSSSWCQGLAAVCDCGTPWTFLLTFNWRGWGWGAGGVSVGEGGILKPDLHVHNPRPRLCCGLVYIGVFVYFLISFLSKMRFQNIFFVMLMLCYVMYDWVFLALISLRLWK